MVTGDQGRERAELRLALVCYGGVSLAVYMHGVTKELQSLIRAARLFEKPAFQLKGPPIGTESVYLAALEDLKMKGKQLSVSIDIVGGTSAGGINGIALSKALATGASQEPLKKVWIQDGDIRSLLRAPAFWLPGQALVAAGRQLFRLFGATTPLRGEVMSRLILKALNDMDEAPRATTLIPDDGTLELYVPATDLGGFDVLVPSGAGGASNHDRQNAQVFEFCSMKDQFEAKYTPDLAFAARASASFPGAFAPISQKSFMDDVKPYVPKFNSDVFHYQYPALADEKQRQEVAFVDGGVLDNAPFDVVISAISRRRADSEVYRRLVYIEPDPGRDLYAYATEAPPSTQRRWLSDLLAVSKVKGNHPFLRDLLELRDMNGRIGEVSAITERQKAYVVGAIVIAWKWANKQLDEASVPGMGYGTAGATTLMTDIPDDRIEIQKLSNAMHIWAKDDLGPAFSTYQRLKFDASIQPLANSLADKFGFSKTSAQAVFIESVIAAWVRQQPFWSTEPDKTVGAQAGDLLGKTLQPIDVRYRERRLMFILAGIGELYNPTAEDGQPRPTGPPAGDLNNLKKEVWNLLEKLRKAPREAVETLPYETVSFLDLKSPPPTDPNRRKDPMLADPTAFAVKHGPKFQALFDDYTRTLFDLIGNGGDDLWSPFKRNTTTWAHDDKQALLSRYLGFPLWDGMIFPTLSLTRVPQLTPIGVHQFSPLMATKLDPPEEKPKRMWPLFWKKTTPGKPTKLKGIPVSHFAGFFSEKSRENDYLWGRLDAAELILRLLQDVGESKELSQTIDPQDDPTVPHVADALQKVLDSEQGEKPLRHVGPLMDFLQEQVTILKAQESTAEQQLQTEPSARRATADKGGETVSV